MIIVVENMLVIRLLDSSVVIREIGSVVILSTIWKEKIDVQCSSLANQKITQRQI
jgi:hypothetical protein